MLSSTALSACLLAISSLTMALPGLGLEVRTVAALNTAAFEEAQQRDSTATRAFSSTTIKVPLATSSLFYIFDVPFELIIL